MLSLWQQGWFPHTPWLATLDLTLWLPSAPGGLGPCLSRPDSWQTKFTHICQDICDIKSDSYSRHNKIQRMTSMSTNSSSTKVLDNHTPPDYNRSGGDDLDASASVYCHRGIFFAFFGHFLLSLFSLFTSFPTYFMHFPL